MPPRLTHSTTLVLIALSRGMRHGFDILDATGLESGTVYPILRRLEAAGCVRSRWEDPRHAQAEGRPPRRNYDLTGDGAAALRAALRLHPDATAAFATLRALSPHSR